MHDQPKQLMSRRKFMTLTAFATAGAALAACAPAPAAPSAAPAAASTAGSTPGSAATTTATAAGMSQHWRGDGAKQQSGEKGC